MAEDWLPHEPPPIEPPKSSAVRTFAIWAVLIVMFLAFYQVMATSEPDDAEQIAAGYSGGWFVLAAVLGALVPIAFMVYMFGGHSRFNALQTAGLEALSERRYSRAAELFAELAKRYRAKPNHYAVALYNRGYALLRSGDSAAAVGVLLGVDRTPKLGGGIRQMAVTQLARAFALGGDVDKATRWLAVARARPAGIADPVHGKALVDAVEGLVMCRQGRVEEAIRHYQECWSRLEACLPIHQMEEAWLLRAFAIASTSGPRDNAAAEPWLRMLRSTPPGALDWITGHWPELATFTITHGLAAAVTAPREHSA